ncbi:hypothetical protein HNR65_003503 [Desulfosalsimonas propionicica]|uniref:Vitamin B12 dependent methionine synthase n=1 Tax=Desulfosalsimonas propionicica TaxID=332175 RepID=A0A7W0HMC2_9BACT|nr:vitamin B12 dependent methionine synthase [Desulfosalsimonas propionicica]MBA2883142.1 hypothetical protein [Desulfosalsimonas propionicica]
MQILDNFQPQINTAEIRKRLHLSADSPEWQSVENTVQEVAGLIRPKCAYKECHVDQKDDKSVTVEGVRFQSRVLRKNLEAARRVFPFVITIGAQLEETAAAQSDYLEQYYLDTIANVALQDAIQSVCARLREQYHLEKLSYMNVGSLEDWPLSQQRPLFSLLGDVEEAIGVRLSSSMLMHPSKSESGIFFPTEVSFFNCQLCPRKDCSSRKAAFDREMALEYGVAE